MLVNKYYVDVWVVLLSWLSLEEWFPTSNIFERMKSYADDLSFANHRPGNVSKVLEGLSALGLVEEGKTLPDRNAEKQWKRSEVGNNLLLLVRAALYPGVRMTPQHWRRLDFYNGESMSYGRLCRGIERIIIVCLLEGRSLSRQQLLNGLGWICGPSVDQEHLRKIYLTPLMTRGFVVVQKNRYTLTAAGSDYLKLLRKALNMNNQWVKNRVRVWDSVLDYLDQDPIGRQSQLKEAALPTEKVISGYRNSSMLRPYLWLMLGRDGFEPENAICKVFPPERQFNEWQSAQRLVEELETKGLLKRSDKILRTAESGREVLKLLAAVISPRLRVLNKPEVPTEMLSDLRRLALTKIVAAHRELTIEEVAAAMSQLFRSVEEAEISKGLLGLMANGPMSLLCNKNGKLSLSVLGQNQLDLLRELLPLEIRTCTLETFVIVRDEREEVEFEQTIAVEDSPLTPEEQVRRFLFDRS